MNGAAREKTGATSPSATAPTGWSRRLAKEGIRLFALFLDDYHIDSHPAVTLRLQRALESFVDALQPTDLVVVMDSLTTLDSLTFTRDKWTVRERIRTFKGRRGELTPVRSVVEEAH